MRHYKDLFHFSGFSPFLFTQFLGAFNDNVYKIVISMFAVDAGALFKEGGGYLSLVGAVFILPFLLFSGYAGYLSDRFNKRTVLIVTKSAEIGAAAIGFWVLTSGRIDLMLAGLFLMAVHSTFFSPAKYGILPEMLPAQDLSRANGLLEMSTFLAIILGSSLGSVLFAFWKGTPGRIGLVLISVALAGTLLSFGIGKVSSPAERPLFRRNPWKEILQGIRRLKEDPQLGIAVICISLFWLFGALLQMDILLFGKEIMRIDDLHIGLLGAFLAAGIGIGSLVAGTLSGNRVELGLVPPGLAGMAFFSLILPFSGGFYFQFAFFLSLLGFSGGLFIVPFNTFLQLQSQPGERGRILATNNFFNMTGVLTASLFLWILNDVLKIPPGRILIILGLSLFMGGILLLTRIPYFLSRFFLWIKE
ncbi:MAG: MFS transporter [Nitrospirae bacterium]|nr:MFS transporter [Nitrospirota bacterium]